MANEETKDVELTGEQYINAINELKATTVSRDAYDRVKQENKQLLDSLVSGNIPQDLVKKTEKPDISKLRQELYGGERELTNLEFAEKTLALRDALIGSGATDPFLPTGEKARITSDTIDAADRVATVLRECVEFAEGDSGIFTAELQRRTVDNYYQSRGRR